MAINVYLVFFWSTNPTSFRKHLWIYCAICFGVPAVPAFICLFYRPGGAYIYGDAIVSSPFFAVNDDRNLLTDVVSTALVLD